MASKNITGSTVILTIPNATESESTTIDLNAQGWNDKDKVTSITLNDGTTFTICNDYTEAKGGVQLRVQTIEITYSDSNPIPEPSDLQYVDLGLPSGTLWANMNIGANAISGYGDYFAWGEVSPKNNYSSKTYKYYKSETINDSTYVDDDGFTVEIKGGTYGGFTKYVLQKEAKEYSYKDFYDNQTRLDDEDDAPVFRKIL